MMCFAFFNHNSNLHNSFVQQKTNGVAKYWRE